MADKRRERGRKRGWFPKLKGFFVAVKNANITIICNNVDGKWSEILQRMRHCDAERPSKCHREKSGRRGYAMK